MTNNTPDYNDNLYFEEKKMNDIKYTQEDIDRIYKERVYSSGHIAGIKKRRYCRMDVCVPQW